MQKEDTALAERLQNFANPGCVMLIKSCLCVDIDMAVLEQAFEFDYATLNELADMSRSGPMGPTDVDALQDGLKQRLLSNTESLWTHMKKGWSVLLRHISSVKACAPIAE